MKWKKIDGFELIINEDDYQSFYIDKSEENYQLCGITKNNTENILCKGTYSEIKKAFDSMVNALEKKDGVSKQGTGQFVLTPLEYDILNYYSKNYFSRKHDCLYFFEISMVNELKEKGHFKGVPKNCPIPLKAILDDENVVKTNYDENTYLAKRWTCYEDKIYSFTIKIPEEDLNIIKKFLVLILQEMDAIDDKEFLENKTIYGLLKVLNKKANEFVYAEEFGVIGSLREKDMSKIKSEVSMRCSS